jgi:hypothetical protein
MLLSLRGVLLAIVLCALPALAWAQDQPQGGGSSSSGGGGVVTTSPNGGATGILAVGGNASSTPIPTTVSGVATSTNQTNVQGPTGAGTAPSTMVVGGAIYNSSAPTLTNGQSVALQVDSGGRLIISPTNLSTNFAAVFPGAGSAVGGDALSAEPTAYTTGNLEPPMLDLVGKTVTSPYANRENMLRGSASETGTSAGTILPASGSASLKEYMTDIECGRTDAGTTAIYVTLNDTSSTVIVLPNSGGGGANSKTFNTPLVFAANTAATFTASSGVSTVYCSAQGFKGY